MRYDWAAATPQTVTAPFRSLLLGAGHTHAKRVALAGNEEWKGKLTTLDMSRDVGADVVWDLDNRPLPFEDETFDELAAYDVLEHIGRQGDWKGFFDEFAEYWRILKPGGEFSIIVPINADALGDPGHTRFFHKNYFGFLNQAFYEKNIKAGTAATDYRWYWKLNFETAHMQEREGRFLFVILVKA